METWIQVLLGSSALSGLFVLIGKWLGWFSPREKADVKKVESDIRIDEATITSKKIEDEIKVSQQALEWTAQFAAQLEKANKIIDRLQGELEKMRTLNAQMREDHGKQIDDLDRQINDLERSLSREKQNYKTISEELDKIKVKYGIT